MAVVAHLHPDPVPADPRRFLLTRRVDRRAFLLGSAGVVLLAACGDDEPSSTATVPEATTTTVDPDKINLGQLFDTSPGYTRVDEPARLTWGLFDFQGAPLADQPDELVFQMHAGGGSEDGGTPIGEPLTAVKREEGLPRPYYAFTFTPTNEGIWFAETEIEGQKLYGAFEVSAAGSPGVLPVGDAMPELQTATVDDPLDIDPICTHEPPCDLHTQSFEAARATGKPIVLSISTPAYCQVAICGPVLDLVLDAVPDYPDLQFIHVEPYKAPVPGDPFTGGLSQPMEALGLTFEPALFLVDADGNLAERLDNIWDASEMREALDRLNGTA